MRRLFEWCPLWRITAISISMALLSACQLSYPVAPKIDTRGTAVLATSPAVVVTGTETFNRTIKPVTFFCHAVEFPIVFADAANALIVVRISSGLPQSVSQTVDWIEVQVTDVMLRTMNLPTVNGDSFDHRFDVESRIQLSAKIYKKTGAIDMVMVENQSVDTGGIADDSMTCAKGRAQLEKSLPVLLRKTIDDLLIKIT